MIVRPDSIGGGGDELVGRQLVGDDGLAAGAGLVRATNVDQATGGDPDQPAARVLRQAVGRPLPRRGNKRLLERVLGGGEVSVAAHERREDVRRPLAPHVS